MSSRLRQRSRYPKKDVSNQASNNSCPAESVNSTSGVPLYHLPMQQAVPPPPFTNPTFYPQNQIVAEQIPQAYCWSDGISNQHVAPVQPTPENDAWNWQVENNTNNYNYYYSQPVLDPSHGIEHVQQPNQWGIDHQTYDQAPSNCNPDSMSHPIVAGHEVMSNSNLPTESMINPNVTGYQVPNNDPNVPGSEAALTSWDATQSYVNQAEELPWTYGYPQYYNSQQTKIQNWGPSEDPNGGAPSMWAGNSDYPAFVPSADNIPTEIVNSQLVTESVVGDLNIQSDNSHANQMAPLDQPRQNFNCDTKNNEIGSENVDFRNTNGNDACDLKECAENSESGTLSAFFQSDNQYEDKRINPDQDQLCVQDNKSDVFIPSSPEIKAEQVVTTANNSLVYDSDVSEVCGGANTESSFIQKDNSSSLSKLKSSSLSPIQFVEEPINQEVPESPVNDINSSNAPTALVQPFSNQVEEVQDAVEEPLNQQIPVELGHVSRSSSFEKERIVIHPREESPFKPIRQSNIAISTVSQQKAPLNEEQNQAEESTVVQEVNLETMPDNLERPPDYEELRKQSPLYSSSQSRHLRKEINSSPSSLLSENFNIPNVTLAPAAPPIYSSAKSDKSESSTDSKLDNSSTNKSNCKQDAVAPPSSKSNIHEKQLFDNAVYKANSISNLSDASYELKQINSANSIESTVSNVNIQDATDLHSSRSQNEISAQKYVTLKDSRIEPSYLSSDRNPSPMKRHEPFKESDKIETHPSSEPYRNADYEYDHHRQKSPDKKNPNTDDRSYSRHDDRSYAKPGERPKIDERDFSRPNERAPSRPNERDFSRPDERSPSRSNERDYSRPDERAYSRPDERAYSRPDERAYSTPDERAYSKPDERAYSKPDERAYSKPDERDYSRPHDKSFSRPDERNLSRPGERNFQRPDDRSFSRPDERSFSRPDERRFSRPDEQGFSRPDERSFSRPDERSFSRPDERSFSRPDERSFSRPDERSFSRPNERSFSRPDERSFSRPDDRGYYRPDERGYYYPDERSYSRPSSRASSVDREKLQVTGGDSSVYPSRDYDRHIRSSESDLRSDKQSSYGGFPPNQHGYPNHPQREEYSQRSNYPAGYNYDSYQRDPYYAYYDAYRYAYSNYNYGFYDELYRNDPRYKQYREAQEQYRQYYAKYGYGTDVDRSSVHSGRSSTNDILKEITPNQYPEPGIDSNESEYSLYNQHNYPYGDGPTETSSLEVIDKASTPSSRLTPVKFSYAHPIARFFAGGLITIEPSLSSMTVTAPVQIHNLQALMENEEMFADLKNYQGPLIRGSTHKNDVIEFCIKKIKDFKEKKDIVDRESYVLLWELMVLLLRQNGSVVGSDIAELLLRDHEVLRPLPFSRPVVDTQGENSPAETNDSPSQSHTGDTPSPDEGIFVVHDKTILNSSHALDIDKITRKFREFLLFGHKKDALEWAMKHGLWGHALFLASKMEVRTYASVMTRFANSLTLNDPLQTLYQLMSGRQPSAVTFVADKKWGDWRPHLAMILSNPSSHPDVDSRSITTLGDTLASSGCLAAAHFCYIMAQVEFGTFEQKNSKLVLLSADHLASFVEFASNEAVQCTEIYEYAQSLANPGFMLIHLQYYKFIYAMRLMEHGLLEEALHYCEVISENFQAHPHLFSFDLVSEVLKLSMQLKYHDPHFLRGEGELQDQKDPDWLINLTFLIQNWNNPLPTEDKTPTQNQESIHNNTTVEGYNSPSYDSAAYQSSSNTAVHNESYTSASNQNQVNFYQPSDWGQHNNLVYPTSMPSNTQDTNFYQGDTSPTQTAFHGHNAPTSFESNETDLQSSPVAQSPPFDYYSGSTQQEWSSLPSISLSDAAATNHHLKSDDLEGLVRKNETESDGALCSSTHSTPLHDYNNSKDDSDDRCLLMARSHPTDESHTLNSCLKSNRMPLSKYKKCIKFDSSASNSLQRSVVRRRKITRKKDEAVEHSDTSSLEGSPSKSKSKEHSRLSLLASLGIVKGDSDKSKQAKRKKKAKKKREVEDLLLDKKTFAIDEPCDASEDISIQKETTFSDPMTETKNIIAILRKLTEDEKKNSELSKLMANEFKKKPPLIFGGTYPIDEPVESSSNKYGSFQSRMNISSIDAKNVSNSDKNKLVRKSKQVPSMQDKIKNEISVKNTGVTKECSSKYSDADSDIFAKMSPFQMLKKIHSSGKKLLTPKEDFSSEKTASLIASPDKKIVKTSNIIADSVHEGRQSLQESLNSFSSSTISQRERRDSTMSTGSRYSSGSLSVANKTSNKENIKSEVKKEKPNSQVGKTWLGGIFSRLLPKAPNQMILPDDKNPTIVWDSSNSCWINKDSNEEDELSAPAAPPTDMELMGSRNSIEKPPVNISSPLAMSSTNKFQRPKTRAMRQNYVDVLNPGNTSTKANILPDALFPSPQPQTSAAPQMFMPVSEHSMTENPQDFAPVGQSSLSNQPILEAMEQPQAQESAPLMLDPAEFNSRRSNFGAQRHNTLGRSGRRAYPS